MTKPKARIDLNLRDLETHLHYIDVAINMLMEQNVHLQTESNKDSPDFRSLRVGLSKLEDTIGALDDAFGSLNYLVRNGEKR